MNKIPAILEKDLSEIPVIYFLSALEIDMSNTLEMSIQPFNSVIYLDSNITSLEQAIFLPN